MKLAAGSMVVFLGIAVGAGGAVAVQGDKAAILDVIERQASTFWAKDFAAWSDTSVHADYVRRVGWSLNSGVISVEGWDAIGSAMKKTTAENPTPDPTPAKLVRDHVNVRAYKDVAWVTFDQHGVDTGDTRFDMPGLSHETRILETARRQVEACLRRLCAYRPWPATMTTSVASRGQAIRATRAASEVLPASR
jgi:hypothetical protein